MNHHYILKSLAIFILSVLFISSTPLPSSYPKEDVEMTTLVYQGHHFKVVEINRTNQKIKAKYFACKEDNKSVAQRFEEWKYGKNVVLLSSGTYLDNTGTPQGLTIDNGRLVNEAIADWDAFVIVEATGGIRVADLKNNKVNLKCDGTMQHYDIKNNNYEKAQFIQCARAVAATTFQTHLLVYDDKIRVAANASSVPRERRFLIAAYKNNVLYHVIINIKEFGSLLERTQEAYTFLKNELGYTSITYMVNLDVGYQDVFRVFNPDGSEKTGVWKGEKDESIAANLIVYYSE